MTDESQIIPDEQDPKAKEYSRIKIQISIFNIGLSLLLLIIMTFAGVSVFFREWAAQFSSNSFSIVFFYFTAFYLFSALIDFPIDLYASFFLEHKYNLSNQTFGAWVLEDLKKKALSFTLGCLVVEVLYLFLRLDAVNWWLWCWVAWIFFSLILNKLVPVLIVPLFYKYTEITDENLRGKILSLVQGTKLKVKNIYSLNLSKTTKKANAAFMGLGSTKRVVLSDTLIEQFTADEIEVVFAHELGHFTHKHIVKNIAVSVVASFVGFFIASYVLNTMLPILKFNGVHDVASFPLLCLVFSVMGLIVMPLQNGFSRHMEREADAYALEHTKKKRAFITTMLKLAEINLSDLSPHPIIEFIFYSHPSLTKRIAWAETQKGYEE